MAERPLASISLDLDNLWSYMKTHGEKGWEARPTYLPRFCPLALEELDRLGLSITFFVVGADAVRDENVLALEGLRNAGHEVGNHSFEHEPWLHLYPRSRLEEEIERAHSAIQAATGLSPVGFRGPGFSWSPSLLEVLSAHYPFDASTFPTFLGPLARAYYFWTSNLPRAEKEARGKLFGGFSEGFRPVKPYQWQLGDGRTLLEIPVTTVPLIKTPFHLSYLLYLARFSRTAMTLYLDAALRTCRVTGTELSFLLHPLDLLGPEDAPGLAFFPAMDLPRSRKIELFREVVGRISERFRLVPMSVHAETLLSRGGLPARGVDVPEPPTW